MLSAVKEPHIELSLGGSRAGIAELLERERDARKDFGRLSAQA